MDEKPFISPTALIKFRESPQIYYREYIQKIKESSSAMDFGNMVHMMILEPEKFEQTYMTIPNKTDDYSLDELKEMCRELNLKVGGNKRELAERIRTLKPDFKIWEEIEDAFPKNKIMIPPQTLQDLLAIKENVFANKSVAKVINESKKEVFKLIEKPEYKMRFKCDGYGVINNIGIVYDIKVTKDWQERWFLRNNFKEGRHIQAACYLDALTDLENTSFENFLFICIEPIFPFRVRAYQADIGMLEAGRSERDFYLSEFIKRYKKNDWKDYPDTEIKQTSLGEWDWENVREIL